MEELSKESSDTDYLIIPKREIVEELEITFENDFEDNNHFIVPKEEITENFDEQNNINQTKTEKMLTEEFIIPKEEIKLDDKDSVIHDNNVMKPIKVELMLSKEVIQLRQQDPELKGTSSDLIETSEFSDSQQRKTPRKTPAQRHREYRERRKLISASEQSNNQQSNSKTKTAAQRHREYRERRKLLLASELSNADQQSTQIRTEAQRHKEYRERKKRLAAESLDTQLSATLPTSTSRVVKFRERALIKKLSSIVTAQDASREEKLKELKRKRNRERQRAYYQRQKDLKKNEKKIKKERKKKETAPKSNAERQREFRQRNAEKSYVKIIKDLSYDTKSLKQPTQRNIKRTEELSAIQNDTTQNVNEASKPELEIEMEVDEVNKVSEDIFTPDPNVQIYSNYCKHAKAHIHFYNLFKSNTFGHSCAVCDRLCWEKDLKVTCDAHENVLQVILPDYVIGTTVRVCFTCKIALDRKKIPSMSTYNGFYYSKNIPPLPKLDLISERLISPRIPFTQIRRLRHVRGRSGLYGQIINVPVEVNTMVKELPRSNDDDHCFYVNIDKKLVHKTSDIHGLVNKKHIQEWLAYLIQTPVYVHHKITINHNFFNNDDTPAPYIEEVSEHIPIEDSLNAQQQTLIWNEDMFLNVASDAKVLPVSKLFDEHAEELSFPTIYGGQFKTYRDGVQVSPFMQASSELRRTDRRGVAPDHLLYVAFRIMRQRVKDSVAVAFKHVGAGRERIKSEGYIEHCIETNLAFLRCIPNSAWYWSDRKKDLLAMIRQKGAPHASVSLSAGETGWDDLLKLLYRLKHAGADISDEALAGLDRAHRAALVNEDSVVCAIYFNKIVNCLIHVLQSKKKCPFGKYRVLHYFKRIEFQHRGGPVARILLWLENAPADLNNDVEIIRMAEELISVSESEASGNIKLQTHSHTAQCYKKTDLSTQDCRFGAPFMPIRQTITLSPMKDIDEDTLEKYRDHYKRIRTNLESVDYADFEEFYAQNNIESDEHYHNIIRAGVNRSQLLYKRKASEKWHDTFNPFLLHHLKSNMNIQIIHDEYSCAAHVAECARRARDISDLQRRIIETMDHPEFDITEITRQISVDVFNSIEMSVQEAAWYLLREPMAKSSIATVYIPTVHPAERQRIRRTLIALNAMDDDYSDICKENWFDKYQKRPTCLEKVTLAQFVAKYCKSNRGEYIERKEAKVIRYRNYEMAEHFNDYRREMVLLHVPFRNEDRDVLADNKFIQLFEDNKDLILERRKEFELNRDIQKTLELCRQLCTDEKENEDEESSNRGHALSEADPYQQLLRDPQQLCARLSENSMDTGQFQELMRSANKEQKELLMHFVYHLQTLDRSSFQFF